MLKEVKNNELAEERDRKRRACNLIIHGAVEEEGELTKQNDEKTLKELIDTISKDTPFKSHIRLGEKTPEKTRPIKVTLNNTVDKEKITSNLTKLKGVTKFGKISVTEDFTVAERDLLKK